MTEFLQPTSDVAVGGWTTNTGATSNLYQSIDDNSDADYIKSPLNPDGTGIYKTAITNPSALISSGTQRFRIGKGVNNATQIDCNIKLMMGATEIGSWDFTDISYTPTTETVTLTSGELAAITSPNDLEWWATFAVPASFAQSLASTTHDTNAGTTANQITFSNIAIGAAASDRILVLAITCHFIPSGIDFSTVTVDGNAATKACGTPNLTSGPRAQIWYMAMPVGTTATVVVGTWGGGAQINNMSLWAYRIVGASSTVPTSTNSKDADFFETLKSVTVPTGGVAIAAGTVNGPITWVNATSDGTDVAAEMGAARNTTAGAQSIGVESPGASWTNTHCEATWGP